MTIEGLQLREGGLRSGAVDDVYCCGILDIDEPLQLDNRLVEHQKDKGVTANRPVITDRTDPSQRELFVVLWHHIKRLSGEPFKLLAVLGEGCRPHGYRWAHITIVPGAVAAYRC
jgi:hypothetical protein